MGVGDNEGGLGGLTEDQLATLDTSLEKAIEVEKKFKDIATAVDDYSEALRRGYNIQEKSVQELEKRIEKATDLTAIQEQINIAENLSEQTLGRINKILEDTSLTSEEARKKILKSLQDEKAQFDLIKKASKEADGFVGGIAGKLGIANKFSETAVGKFTKMSKMLMQSGKGSEILMSSLATTLSPANILASLFEKIFESIVATAIALDSAESALQRSTGFAVNFRDSMLDVAQANVMSGVSIEDTQKATAALINTFSDYSPTAREANESLLETTTLLDKIGVTAEVSTKQIDFFMKAMGETKDVAQALTVQIAMAADKIGISASKMSSDFAAVSSDLSVYGNQMTDVFFDLQAQAKATGIEISQLVKIGKQFDTFDKAAEITGKLNSVLGTNLSSMQMINMSEAERVKLLRQELKAVAGNFDSLDKYTKIYIAQAAGLGSVAEARRFVTASEADYLSYNAKMQERAATQQQLKEATESFVPIVDALKIAILNLALAFKPVINIFITFAELLTKNIDLIYSIIGAMVIYSAIAKIVSIATILYATAQAIATRNNQSFLFSLVPATLGLIYHNVILPITTFLSNLFAVSQMALGKAVAFASIKLTAFAVILYLVYKAITKKGSPPLYMIGFTMALAIIAMGVAVKMGGNKLLIFAGILAVIFLAVHLVLESISGLVSVISQMFQMFIDNVAILPQLALGLYLVGGAFLFFAASVASGATMLAMAAPFLLMAAVAMAPLVAEVFLLGRAFEMIGGGMEQIVAGLQAISAFKSDDEFFAIQTSGEGTTMVSATGGILKSFSSDKLSVEVKIPEINMPTPVVKVYIGDTELRTLIRKEMGTI